MTCPTCAQPVRAGAPFCAACGSPVAATEPLRDHLPLPDPLIGQVLARKFRVRSLLGEGGMGRVYVAAQLPLDIEVVIKTLHVQLAGDRTLVQRFFREAQAASRLRHPNCVSILDFGDSDGTLYIAMELSRGRLLSRVLREDGAFSVLRTIRVMGQVLDVLEVAHQMNIVHRDLKPDNIMLEDHGTQRDFVKVLDFGIAKILDPLGRQEKLTQTGMIFGTPSYMAPEQASGEEVDTRADIYAFGVVMFELLAARLPFNPGTLAALIADKVTGSAPPIASLRADLSPKLAAVVDTALARLPNDRYQTALELRAALADAEAEARGITTMVGTPAAIPAAELVACPRCGQRSPAAAKFCAACGAGISTKATRAPAHDDFADLRQFLPSAVVDDLAELRKQAPTERREVVVLVVDAAGAALQRSDERAERLGDELFTVLADVARRHTGVLDRRLGQGAVAAFGLAMTNADDAERAVAAALEMRDAVKALGVGAGAPIDATFAIHAGTASVAGPHAYTPIGNTVELPARLAATSAAGKIVVTDAIEKQIRSGTELRQLPSVSLKGAPAPVPVYEVLSVRAIADMPHASLARPPFCGRDEAVTAIVGVLATARGQTIHVTGEPGIGKSRLLEELAFAIARKHLHAIVAPARPGADRLSPTLVRIVDALGGTQESLYALGVEGHDLRLLFDWLARDRDAAGGDERVLQTALAACLRTALSAHAERTPVAILVDDLHLADPMTTAVVARWVADPIPHTTLVVTTRTGRAPAWPAGEARTATLAPLGDPAIAAIVAGALAPNAPPREVEAAVVARSGGSPLMALESLRSLIDAGVLAFAGGKWIITGELASVRPGGLRALYAARVDALTAYARDVLAAAAVIGEDVPLELLARVVSHARGVSIEREVRALVGRGLLVERSERERSERGRSDRRLAFAEPSAREAIYDRLGRDARRQLHRAVAEALERAGHGSAPEAIAEHHEAAGDPDKALAWFARAGELASRAGELARATAILRRSRDVARTSNTSVANRRFAEDSLRLGNVLLDTGDVAAARDTLSEGLVAGHKEGDPALIARLQRARGRAHLGGSNLEAAITDFDGALTSAIDQCDRALQAELHGDLGEVQEKRGDTAKAIAYGLRALELAGDTARAVEPARIALRVLTNLGRLSVRAQEPDRAERFLQQALALAEAAGDKLAATKVLGNLAGVWHARGDFKTATKFSERALQLSRELGDLVGIARQLTNLGTLATLQSDHVTALRHYDDAYTAASRGGWREGMATAAAARDRISSARKPAR